MPQPLIKDTGPVPPMPRYPRAGDTWRLMKPIKTVGGDVYEVGELFHLLERTEEAPFGFKYPEGNWKVVAKGRASVWSSIPYMVADRSLSLVESGPEPDRRNRFEREDPI